MYRGWNPYSLGVHQGKISNHQNGDRLSAVFPIVVKKKCPAEATRVYFGSQFKGAIHHGWEGLADVPLRLRSEAQREEVWCSTHSILNPWASATHI